MALAKAVIINLDERTPLPIPVMFNPPEYTLSKTNQFAEIKIPGLPSSILQFVNGDAQSLSMELFFDTTDSSLDVRSRTIAIANLTEPTAQTKAPPRLLLLWGSLAFSCFLISVKQHFEYFNSFGLPLRARLTVEFKGNTTAESMVAGAPAALVEQAARYIVKSSDTLQGIAAAQLNDPSKWREIAIANNIDNPRALANGQRLTMPKSV
ncbi:MAG TPA: LysM peptidoglycan-binding domain-containing protein [Nitrosomonas sp.]|nr:LysM peptidoglycan-binding domain-containing protein [Nitrosomonas sp.]